MKVNSKQDTARLLIELNKQMQAPGQKQLMRNFYGGVRLMPVSLRIARGAGHDS